MMKKFLTTILFAVLLFSCLGLTALANVTATLSEDYQTLTLGEKTYTRVNATIIQTEYYEEDYTPVVLSAAQQGMIQSISLQSNENKILMTADIIFTDGATLNISYLQIDYLADYQMAVEEQAENYIIDFIHPEENEVIASSLDLHINDVMLSQTEWEDGDYYDVYIKSKDNKLCIRTGILFSINEEFFYVSFSENEISNYVELSMRLNVKSHKITNENLISKLGNAETTYYAQDLGVLFSDDLSEKIASVFLIIVFGGIPFALFVLFLILAIRSKTFYKKLFRVIYGLSASVLIISFIVAALILR